MSMTFLVSNIAFSFRLISLSSCLHYTWHDQSFLSRFCLYGTVVWFGFFFDTGSCLKRWCPQWSSYLRSPVCWDFRNVPLYLAIFCIFHQCIFSFLFLLFHFSSNLHSLYKYYSMFMFFMDFTSKISSLSPLTFFVACVCLLVYVVVLCACACGSQRTVFIVGFQLLPFSMRQDLIDLDSVSTALRLQVCTGFCMGSGELAKDFTNWGINAVPFNVCLTCTWESLVLGCAFYYRSVIKEKTPTKKHFLFFYGQRLETFIVFWISLKKAALGWRNRG